MPTGEDFLYRRVIRSISAGVDHMGLITGDGQIYMVGKNTYGSWLMEPQLKEHHGSHQVMLE